MPDRTEADGSESRTTQTAGEAIDIVAEGDSSAEMEPAQLELELPLPDNPAKGTVKSAPMKDEGSILREYRRVMYQFSFIGIEFGVALALGFLLGHWLDKKLGTSPWLMLACVLFGLGVATRDLFRLIRKARERQSRKGTED